MAEDEGYLDTVSESLTEIDTQKHKRRPRLHAASKGYIVRGKEILVLHKPEQETRYSLSPEAATDLPGGRMEFGETFEDCLVREILEETGLVVRIILPFHTWSFTRNETQVVGVDFLCEWVSGEVVLSEEHDGFEWLTKEEIDSRHWYLEPVFDQAFSLYDKLMD
ncbi:MAG: NUDIX domain-containing protein [Eggerthellaceae bacterium]|nr:NUDIX domain-containing protein [Eggerthellaceae bacterium]